MLRGKFISSEQEHQNKCKKKELNTNEPNEQKRNEINFKDKQERVTSAELVLFLVNKPSPSLAPVGLSTPRSVECIVGQHAHLLQVAQPSVGNTRKVKRAVSSYCRRTQGQQL